MFKRKTQPKKIVPTTSSRQDGIRKWRAGEIVIEHDFWTPGHTLKWRESTLADGSHVRAGECNLFHYPKLQGADTCKRTLQVRRDPSPAPRSAP